MAVDSTVLKITQNKVPVLIDSSLNGFSFIETRTNTDLQWSANPNNDAWHTLKSGETYEFGFDIYIRKISAGTAVLVITK